MTETTVDVRGRHVAPDDEKPRKKRFKLWQKILLIVVAVLVVLVAVAAISAAVITNTGKAELLSANDSTYAFKRIKHDGKVYEYNDNMVSVVLVGTDKDYGNAIQGTNGQADAVIVVAYNTETGKIDVINTPRNLWFECEVTFEDGEKRKQDVMLSAMYALASDDVGGALQVCDAVSQLFGRIPMKFYAAMNMQAVGPLADAMGGVTLVSTDDVPVANIVKGETYTLKSWAALRYVQYRNPDIPTSPADRVQRQQDFAKAFVNQTIAAAKEDPMVLKRLYDVITNPEYMVTNLDFDEIAYLAANVVMKGVSDLQMQTVPYEPKYSEILDATEYIPQEDELTQMLIDVYYLPVEEG